MKSITTRLMASVSMVVAGITLIVLVASYFVAARNAESDLREQMDSTSDNLMIVLRDPVFTYDNAQIDAMLGSFVRQHHVYSIKVSDHRGKVLGEKKQPGEAVADNYIVATSITLKGEGGEKLGQVDVGYRRDFVGKIVAARVLNIALTVLCVLAGVLATLYGLVRKLVTQPVAHISRALRDIAAEGGDLTKRLESRSNDELGVLSQSFNQFVDNLQQLIASVVDSANALALAADSLSAKTEGTAVATEQQLERTSDMVQTLGEMARVASDVAERAQNTATSAHDASDIANSGATVVLQTVEQVHQLGEEMRGTGERIAELRTHSDSIGRVLEVIKGISDQTNLLALNAAIEAARAGESGRGFAVVADEVRTLSQRTQQSTAEIQRIIDTLQQAARNTNESMDRSRTRLDSTIAQAREAGNSLERIRTNIDTIDDMNGHVAQAAEEQSRTIEGIDQGINSIRDLAQAANSNAAMARSESENVRKISEAVKTELGRFKI